MSTATSALTTSRHNRRAATGVAFAMIAVVLVVVVGALINLVGSTFGSGFGGGSGGGPPGGYAPELEAAWELPAHSIGKGGGTFDPADGTLPGTVLETETGWIAMTDASELTAELVSVDPETGEVQWSTPMPEGRCTLSLESAVVCLTRESGSPYDLVTVSAETGERLGDAVPTELTHVPAFLTAMGTDGVMTMSVDAGLTGLDLQGTTLWSQPVDLGDY